MYCLLNYMAEQNKPISILNRTTLIYQLEWEDEPRESLRMRCLEFERRNNDGNWALYILPNIEELDSGWWKLYEIDSSRIGREWRSDTEIAMSYIRWLLVPVANQLELELDNSKKLEKVCIQDLVERVAKKVDVILGEFVDVGSRKTVFPPEKFVRCDVYQKPDGTTILLREDPMPFNEENRKIWAQRFYKMRKTTSK